MDISRNGTRPSVTPSADNFTGTVRMDPLFQPIEPSKTVAMIVTFEPGARTNWHTHPHGQRLYIMQGVCRCQIEGELVQECHPGDVIWFPPDVRHWHGAGPDLAMVHMAIQEKVDGRTADWLEPVSDAQYEGG